MEKQGPIEILELGTEVDRMGVLVVAEQVADAAPEGVGGVGVLRDGGETLGGDAVVEPRDDGAVVLHPIVVALGRGAVDVVTETIQAEDGGEGSSLGCVVRLVEVENDRHPIQDVDAVHDRGSSGLGLNVEGVGQQRFSVGVVGGR